jgi:hypothetical protein
LFAGVCKKICASDRKFDSYGNCICSDDKEDISGKCYAKCYEHAHIDITLNKLDLVSDDKVYCVCDEGYAKNGSACLSICEDNEEYNIRSGKCKKK